ncbi:DUF3052 domain-containing protein [Phenylobacterium sp. J367]|uniref:DUF3052 domain-containing protein n=1 Tax=Phenylobacterium sp. J367 TaxID=2898435 RepID=UPI002151F2ED|nr:DUF3052 domain-containing protein [Phenylobacterium sp. J367]MCR5881003.1 DUF3052 domain-containing protein [Phenylobacterium sp. J367]
MSSSASARRLRGHGQEAQVKATFADGEDEGRLQLEPPRLVFRGAQRRVFEGEALQGVRAEGDDLVLADGSRFALGEKRAAAWADSILNPRTRMAKIGAKPGMRAAVIGVADIDLTRELAEAGAQPVTELAGLDLLFYAADSAEALARIGDLVPTLSDMGALWVLSRKGKAATVKDVEVMAAAKAAGLVDNKVVGFSDTLTALRFVRRKA